MRGPFSIHSYHTLIDENRGAVGNGELILARKKSMYLGRRGEKGNDTCGQVVLPGRPSRVKKTLLRFSSWKVKVMTKSSEMNTYISTRVSYYSLKKIAATLAGDRPLAAQRPHLPPEILTPFSTPPPSTFYRPNKRVRQPGIKTKHSAGGKRQEAQTRQKERKK